MNIRLETEKRKNDVAYNTFCTIKYKKYDREGVFYTRKYPSDRQIGKIISIMVKDIQIASVKKDKKMVLGEKKKLRKKN